MTPVFDRLIAEAERLHLRWRLVHNEKGHELYFIIGSGWFCVTDRSPEEDAEYLVSELRREFSTMGTAHQFRPKDLR